MVHFAFFKEIFYGIGSFFEWSFQILPPIGIVANCILSLVVLGLLIFWCLKIISYGKDDKREVDYREPHNFLD
ncbi:Uncharacterised protein [Candidatus Ornithobacterium hominis]|uniref:Uncharacterized protein n=1 Tax=Candidatus Ornithobacterium hominis TaxID=2497989 RepID=A0A383TUP3_9FLAO|nr:hypothetical protein [Candidatus Ornithobacterium hominis]MCT7903611.1 hypothetical protein [Candidatus Ornithobacterium hominis]SZD70948.1 Uncharacterised protein [Candidatus Ornithobacterium hominis]SZD71501.1 Uncharacterised protein [Candidatus Ornithobacterium hominis]